MADSAPSDWSWEWALLLARINERLREAQRKEELGR